MRRITLLRHAKSSWGNPSLSDFERPLNSRGERDAPTMGARLSARGVRPALIVSSDALRALTTAQIVATAIDYPNESIQANRDLYLASPERIIDVVIQTSEHHTDVMLVGHNPGLTELANQLGNLAVLNIPTCGAVAIDLEIDDWNELAYAHGTTAWFDYPKNTAV
jgi:phosphohistidine phosphatase